MGILKTAFLTYFPPARKRAAARDQRYQQARALGCSAEDFNLRVALVRMKYPFMFEIDAMDEVIEQLRKGASEE